MGVFDVPAQELIVRTAKELKQVKEIAPPEWGQFVKTGAGRDRPPADSDWWYMRSASVLRKLFILGPVGVSKLKVKYGNKKNRGVAPGRFYPASGNILRKILQQLEKAGLAKSVEKNGRKGRVASPQGVSLLDKVSADIMKEQEIVLPKIERPTITPVKKKAAKKRKAPKRKAAKKAAKSESKSQEEAKPEEKSEEKE